MKVAVVGSRTLTISNLEKYLPENTSEIVSGGANGIDACAKKYAEDKYIKYKEFLPKYNLYRRNAPLKRNIEIIEYANFVLVFWGGESRGTKQIIEECEKRNIDHKVIDTLWGATPSSLRIYVYRP